jgi:GNAT superfamily N-acetyltransferase
MKDVIILPADPGRAEQLSVFVRTVGMIEVRDGRHICLFFVDGAFQGRGIGRRLFEAALAQRESTSGYMEVHASPFSVPVYTALGFRKTAGIKYVPMRMEL